MAFSHSDCPEQINPAGLILDDEMKHTSTGFSVPVMEVPDSQPNKYLS
ncbi:hypothetical protein SAMN05192554_1485 [Haloarchaeobius iranensis]|uniref:Uncharacterized protein n=1 Tax=Haloarchaeobius iranensis TaxID=996166 RepID=A0A1H0BUL4_9EURY|nr:hypothetical protein SAMN05192554_1485 [Haloarchaeobius iranensis]